MSNMPTVLPASLQIPIAVGPTFRELADTMSHTRDIARTSKAADDAQTCGGSNESARQARLSGKCTSSPLGKPVTAHRATHWFRCSFPMAFCISPNKYPPTMCRNSKPQQARKDANGISTVTGMPTGLSPQTSKHEPETESMPTATCLKEGQWPRRQSRSIVTSGPPLRRKFHMGTGIPSMQADNGNQSPHRSRTKIPSITAPPHFLCISNCAAGRKTRHVRRSDETWWMRMAKCVL
mmetsp:Transcript_25725/g.71682  ORF Transcript_25725/g.71682 Transcript_25725/m.71682 type:complete len:237 (-) Transcript_25725:148-858(-)